MAKDLLIVGLGNPGRSYEKTRHNIGFMVLDTFLSSQHGASWKEKFQGHFSELSLFTKQLLLIKPQTFMNLSGRAVREISSFYSIMPDQVVVIHDELDLPLGCVRIKVGGGDGGHNGIKSISQEISSKNYIRIRCGIGRPTPVAEGQGVPEVSDYVLSQFTKAEAPLVQSEIARAERAIELILTRGVVDAQNEINRESSEVK